MAHDCIPDLDIAREAALVFSDEWMPGALLADLLTAAGATEAEPGPWLEDEHSLLLGDIGGQLCRTRKVSAMLAVPPAPLAPKMSRATIVYRVAVEGEGASTSVNIEADFTMHDTPYCDYFHVHEQISLLPSPEGAVVSKAFEVIFSKRTFAQPLILASTLQLQQKSGPVLLDVLARRAGEPGKAQGLRRTASLQEGGKVVEVWELQRRVTVFHDTWQAPFLPHDLSKRWRWVNEKYLRHQWVACPRNFAATSDLPSLEIPTGWHCRGVGWEVVEAPGPSDEEGWQYAVDFYTSDNLWGACPTMLHCRRRRWRVVLEERPRTTEAFADGHQSRREALVKVASSKFSAVAVIFMVVLLLLQTSGLRVMGFSGNSMEAAALPF